jgi:hypothetical protein
MQVWRIKILVREKKSFPDRKLSLMGHDDEGDEGWTVKQETT